MARLRGENGCPWDREQTHQSLKPYLAEEMYETLDAIDTGDMEHLKEELGDMLLQIVFHSQLANERGDFSMNDVCATISEKLVRRHPHVFGEANADTPEKVVKQWDEIKKSEGTKAHRKSILDGVPISMPALMRAMNLQEKASSVGFDWEGWEGAFEKLEEEVAELRKAISEKNAAHVAEEVGDLLFSIVNAARHMNIDPEEALRKTSGKFTRRFMHVEGNIVKKHGSFSGSSLEEMDALWNEAKLKDV